MGTSPITIGVGKGARALVIPPAPRRGRPPPPQAQPSPQARQAELVICDQTIENSFARLKQYRAIATRYDKRAVHFLGAIHLAAAVVWLN